MVPRLALVTLMLLGCSRPQPVAVGPDPSDAAVAVAHDTPTTADAGTLPPIDRRCSTDADCDWIALEISGADTCCPSCGTTIAARTWTTAVRAICAKAMPPTCAPLACPLGITTSRCDAGMCEPKG